MSMDGRMDEQNGCIRPAVLLSLIKDVLPHGTACVNLEDTVLSDRSHSQKDKYCTIALT